MSDPRSGVDWGTGDRKNIAVGPGEAVPLPILGFCLPIRQVTDKRFVPVLSAVGTTAALGNGTLRAHPLIVPNNLNISHLGMSLTAAGEAGSTVRLGIFNDSGSYTPGTLKIEASAAVAADSAGEQEVACATSLVGGTLYWLASVVQGAPTSQPTVRSLTTPPFAGLPTNAPVGGSVVLGYSLTGITGDLSTAAWGADPPSAGNMARIWLRLA